MKTDQDETLTVRLFGQNPTEVGTRVQLAYDPDSAFHFNDADQRVTAMAA